ncbi:DUF6438 domain-containing protein [Hymenobacter volaticus]|uniref:DUF6438 domain-containing protein n=1 Tax=Hymenobacter volaticus TaxID=2932254 RepID=A0ABY4G3R5_9BACT|nr:DUF6438 domain-containing protein [Hymenobacter volaticus]UOQ65184.1 DUF6438 domain-containing protein [Hymenobacter volaticus]
MRFSFSFLLLAALLASCVSQAQRAAKPTQAASKQQAKTSKTANGKPAAEPTPVIVFRKTPCFGYCPHYEARIYADGRMSYEGIEYAPVEGKREVTMPLATIKLIQDKARALHFNDLPERYTLGTSDLPATSLTIRPVNCPAKTVIAEEGVPAELKEFLSYVEKQVTSALGASSDR